MIKVKNKEEFNVLKNNDITVVKFGAKWCGPCKMMTPVLEEISNEMKDVTFIDIDVDSNSNIASEFNVRSIPFIIGLKGGVKYFETIGATSKANLIEFIKS